MGNSLQIIARILLIKARTVRSEETRLHLQDAHKRVMSIAAMQEQLQALKHAFPDDRSVGSVLVTYTSCRALIEAARRFASGGGLPDTIGRPTARSCQEIP